MQYFPLKYPPPAGLKKSVPGYLPVSPAGWAGIFFMAMQQDSGF
jgi:hypothetical protein